MSDNIDSLTFFNGGDNYFIFFIFIFYSLFCTSFFLSVFIHSI